MTTKKDFGFFPLMATTTTFSTPRSSLFRSLLGLKPVAASLSASSSTLARLVWHYDHHGNSREFLDRVNGLISNGAQLNERGTLSGLTPFHIALHVKCPSPVISLMLDRQPDAALTTPAANMCLGYGACSSLYIACAPRFNVRNINLQVLDLLLTRGKVSPNFPGDPQSILAWMFREDEDDVPWTVIDLLLKHGADPNRPDSNGKSAMYYAVENDDIQYVTQFIERGGRLTASGLKELQALLDDSNLSAEMLTLLDHKKSIKVVTASKPVVKSSLKDNISPLCAAVISENPRKDIVETLLKSGADVNELSGPDRMPALVLACRPGADVEIAETLLKAGANVNARSMSGVSPLHHALSADGKTADPKLVKLLLSYGADYETVSPLASKMCYFVSDNQEIRRMIDAAPPIINRAQAAPKPGKVYKK
jgi:ankyrin repeat protein